MTDPASIPSPQPTAETRPFWRAAAEGRLLLAKCTACGEVHYYPRPFCPFCGGSATWIDSGGQGVVHSYSVMRRAEPPYVIAYVTLDEGVAMMTNIVDCEPDRVSIGQRVKVVFRASADGTPVPMFAPSADSAH